MLLFYNDFAIERLGAKSDATYALMRDLLAAGTPIDGIGFQSHMSIHRYPAESDLRANFRRFGELGLRVNVSELDARTLLMPGSQDSRWQAQRIAFQQVVGACVVEPGLRGDHVLGIHRPALVDQRRRREPDDPLPFDRSYMPKPAYGGILDGLAGTLPRRGDNLVSNGDFAAGGDGWSASGGVLAVEVADGRAGSAACVSGRTDMRHGLLQVGLVDRLSAGGPLAFTAWARLRGAHQRATVIAELIVTEAAAEPRHGQRRVTRRPATAAGSSSPAPSASASRRRPRRSISSSAARPPASSCASPASSCARSRRAELDPPDFVQVNRVCRMLKTDGSGEVANVSTAARFETDAVRARGGGSLFFGLGAGSLLSYLLDPRLGRGRRAIARDRARRAAHEAKLEASKVEHDLINRAHGFAARLRSMTQPEQASDEVVSERVRAALGRVCSRASAIEVVVADGRATLGGPVLEREYVPVMRTAARVRGVRSVEDRLERHVSARG